jgi:hypothetical protein
MTSLRTFRLAWVALALTAVAGLPARADFIPIPQPNAGYLAATSLLPITVPDFNTMAAVTNGTDTVSFDFDLAAQTVPTTWSSWGSPPNTESATPRVLWTNGLTSLTLTSTNPLTIFGLEAQPNTSVISPIQASFFSGMSLVGQISLDVDGNGGARLFAASTSTSPFDRVVLSSTDDFAIAQIRVQNQAAGAVVPEPSGIVLCAGAGVMGLVCGGYRAWRRVRAAGRRVSDAV